MSESKRRIVITGVGAVTPLGTGNDAFWRSLAAGKSGVRKLQSFQAEGTVAQIAAEVTDFDPKRFVKQRKSLKVMARDIQLAVAAAHIAVEDACLDPQKIDSTRFGISCGAGLIATELDEIGVPVWHSLNGTRKFDLKKWGAEGMEHLFPLWMLKYLPNMPACHMSIFYDAQGPNNSITAGEASATLAMGEAFRALERGSADIFIAGGCDSKTNPLSVLRMALLNRLSRRQTAPEEASRPFDVERDGMVVGEGAGLLIFEELEHSVRRGANIWAEVIGFGASCNPGRHQLAIEKAVTRALKDASVSPAELGHVVPHGCSCVEDDRIEAMALAGVLGDARETTPVVGYKSYFGSLTAAGGAVELIASLLGMKNGVLPSTLNTRRQEAEAPKLRILGEPTEFSKKPFLTYDLSHSGQCAALVVRPFEG